MHYGFSMLEVLIAMIVLSIGLLGFGLLQAMSVRMSQSANYRTNATNLAVELMDQMRVNRVDASQYAGSATFDGASASRGVCIPKVGVTQTISEACAQWRCQVVRALGENASAKVEYNNNNVVSVTLSWDERIESDDSTSLTVSSRL